MKKNIWIWNHYATNMLKNEGGRHYWFADNLIKNGYKATIFCASTRHISDDKIEISQSKYLMDSNHKIPFVFVQTPGYRGNGVHRIKNMVEFYKYLFPVAKEYSDIHGKPDVIVASSVHPLTLVAGIKIAKKFGVPCICEIRDLWPETLVAYGAIKEKSILSKALYEGEKWIYKKADKIIFTMEGGRDYITEKGWDKGNSGPIDLTKVYHINNGVDLDAFNYNMEHHKIEDDDLENNNIFKVVYTGSIRKVNEVEKLVDVAKELVGTDVRFLIWGDGDQVSKIKEKIKNENINNIILKGRVDKKYIPYIVSQANLNIILGENKMLYKYGVSLNKLFEYLAAGKPILCAFKTGYSIVDKFNVGVELEDNSFQNISKEILRIKNSNENTYNMYCKNSHKAAEEYSYIALTNKLIEIINNL